MQERGGTLAVGPISLPPGRAALLADRDGATFGVWEGELSTDWLSWQRSQPSFIRLHTRDAFDAAIFYGEVFDWGVTGQGHTEVVYEGDEVVLRGDGQVLACIESGALGSAPDPTIRPHWQRALQRAGRGRLRPRERQRHGGSVVTVRDDEAVLRDNEGAVFTVTARRGG
ncbi:VOC family protein [Streptomyces hirsutus]